MNVEFLLGKAFSNFKNDKVQEYDIWMLKIPALQLKKWGEIGNGSPSVSIFRLLWHLGSFCRLIQQTLRRTPSKLIKQGWRRLYVGVKDFQS